MTCVKKFLPKNQLAIGAAIQKTNPLPIKILKSNGKMLRLDYISNEIVMITSELANNNPPTKPPPGV